MDLRRNQTLIVVAAVLTAATRAHAQSVSPSDSPEPERPNAVTVIPPPVPPAPSSDPPLDVRPLAITLHHDAHGAPSREVITRFGVTGEPLAYTDWLCITPDHDSGSSIEIALDDITVRDESNRALGTFTSASGRLHRFDAFGSGPTRRYCTRVDPRGYRRDSVRFTPDANAPWRHGRVIIGWRGDSAGCVTPSGRHACSELRPALASFSYGFTAMSYAHLDAGRWQGSTIDFSRGLVDPMARYRITGFLPLWLAAIGPPTSFQASLESGLSLPVTFASEGQFGNGTTPRSVVGFGLGLYVAQCFVIRAPVTPRICAGVDVEAVVDGVVQSGVVTATEPRLLGAWFVSIGAGAH